MLFVHDVLHLPVKEREKKRPDVRAVHVRVAHKNDLPVAELADIKLFPYARAKGHNHCFYFFIAENLVDPRFFHIKDLSLQRQYRLESPVPCLLRGTARRISLDYVQLRERGVGFGAICQLPGK